MIRLRIDGREVEVEEGTPLLGAIEQLGINVPTLCYHRALSPYGACRLCLVEVHLPDRAPVLHASCSVAAVDGSSVHTQTERVQRTRAIVAELLLARCPDAEGIKRLALEFGIVEPRMRKRHDDCIYCGLCERMCRERMGRAVLGFSGRGSARTLEPPFRKPSDVCWACGACDFVCPVGKKVSALTTANPPIPIPNPHNVGLDAKPVVHIPYPQAIPNIPAIISKYAILGSAMA